MCPNYLRTVLKTKIKNVRQNLEYKVELRQKCVMPSVLNFLGCIVFFILDIAPYFLYNINIKTVR